MYVCVCVCVCVVGKQSFIYIPIHIYKHINMHEEVVMFFVSIIYIYFPPPKTC